MLPQLCCLHLLFALLNSPFVVATLALVDCVNCTAFFRHDSRELVEALVTAFSVAQVQGPQRLTDCARDEADLLNPFLARIPTPLPLHSVNLRSFRFHTYHRTSFLRLRCGAYRLLLFHFTHCKATFRVRARGLFPSHSFFNFRIFLVVEEASLSLSFETVALSADQQSDFMSGFWDPLAVLVSPFFNSKLFPSCSERYSSTLSSPFHPTSSSPYCPSISSSSCCPSTSTRVRSNTAYSAIKEKDSTDESYSLTGYEPKDYFLTETYVEFKQEQRHPEQRSPEEEAHDDAATGRSLDNARRGQVDHSEREALSTGLTSSST